MQCVTVIDELESYINKRDSPDLKDQCVEYCRQWLLSKKGLIYSDVKIAADIWDEINFYTQVTDNRRIPVSSYLNGAANLPRIGDLVIYCEKYMQTGHVAVVSGISINGAKISVQEKNYIHQKTDELTRHIPFVIRDNRYWLLDEYIIGWKSIE